MWHYLKTRGVVHEESISEEKTYKSLALPSTPEEWRKRGHQLLSQGLQKVSALE
jgi:hypothetical protein